MFWILGIMKLILDKSEMLGAIQDKISNRQLYIVYLSLEHGNESFANEGDLKPT